MPNEQNAAASYFLDWCIELVNSLVCTNFKLLQYRTARTCEMIPITIIMISMFPISLLYYFQLQ